MVIKWHLVSDTSDILRLHQYKQKNEFFAFIRGYLASDSH